MAQVDTSVPVIGLVGPSARLTPEAVGHHLAHLHEAAAKVAASPTLEASRLVWP
jgi:DNA-binding IclR family transcriptional regulator